MRYTQRALKSAQKAKSRKIYESAERKAKKYMDAEFAVHEVMQKASILAGGYLRYQIPDYERWQPSFYLPENYKRLH